VLGVEYIGNSTTHTSGKVLPCSTKDNYAATGHILARVITHAFNYCLYTGVTHTETFTGLPANVCFAGSGPVECNVANNNIILWFEGCFLVGIDNQFSA